MSIVEKMNEALKKYFNFSNKSKVIENTAIVIIIGIIIIIVSGAFNSKSNNSSKTQTSQDDKLTASATISDGKIELEERLAKILTQIEGAGIVDVMITFESEKELVPAYDTHTTDNETMQKDSEGGTSSSKQTDKDNKVVYEETQNGIKKPIFLKEIMPAVKGVVIVAEGAEDIFVKDRLTKAAQVLLDLQPHRIQVFEKSVNKKK